MLCASYEPSTPRRSTGGYYSLMNRTHSMRRNGQQLLVLSSMIGPAARSLPLAVTVTGPLWWCATRRTGQATSCIASRALPRGAP